MFKRKIIYYIVGLVLTAICGFWAAKLQDRHLLYLQDLQVKMGDIDVSLKILGVLREQDYQKAIHAVETAMLVDVAGLADDEKVLGHRVEIDNLVKEVSNYCSKYDVFEGKTNLPSHLAAKRFLDSHTEN